MAKDNVDTKVVRMEFDNKQFEKNIKQTSKSLDNLKQSLDFKGVGDSLEKVKLKISALQVVATTFVATLTNKLINLSTVLVKSLSVDNIANGWAKFGDKTISVATMMAQKIRIAGKVIEDETEKLKVVNGQLELLAWFSDETSYSFTNMTDSVGKFIATGQDLDKSVKAIEGIATWAAMAGQNSMTASMAMTQLAQALGAGSIKLQDWKSIENYHMDMEIFKEAVLETAVSLGQLTKEGDKFVTKTSKKFDQSNFRQYLSEGWFTSDVLIDTLNKYSAAVEQIYEIAERENKTASEVIEEYGDQLDAFGVKAFKAAQEARTLVDVLNSVRDAVSSKWMTTFEKAFGSQENIVKFWTNLANELYEVFAESGNFRNNILDVWSSLGGSEDLFAKDGDHQGAFWNMYDAIIAVRDLIKKAWNTVFPLSMMEKDEDQASDIGNALKNLTLQLREFTTSLKFAENTSSRLYKIFQAIFSILKAGIVILKTIRYVIDPIIELGKRLVGQVLDEIIYSTNKVIGVGNKIEKIAIKLQAIIAGFIDAIDLEGTLSQVFDWLHETYDLISSTGPIETAVNLVKTFIDAFVQAGGSFESIRKVILSAIYIFNLLKDTLMSIISVVLKAILPVIDDVLEIVTKVAGYVLGTVSKIIESVADMIITLVKSIRSSDGLTPIGDSINGILKSLGDLAKNLIPVIGQLIPVIIKFIDVLLMIPKMLNEVSKKLTGRGILDNLVYIFDSITSAISSFVQGLKKDASTGSLQGLFNAIIGVFEGVYELIKGLLGSAQLILTIIGSALKTIGKALQMIADLFIKVFGGRSNELTTAQKSMWKTIVVLAALVATIWLVYTVFYALLTAVHPLGVVADSLSGALDSLSKKLLAESIQAFASSLLEIVVALALLAALDPGKMWSAIAAFAVIIGLLAGMVILLKGMTNATNSIENSVTNLKDAFKNLFQKKDSPMLQLIALVNQIGNLMLKLAISFLIFDKISWEGWQKGIATLGIVVGIVGGLYVLTALMNKGVDKDDSNLKDSAKGFKALIKDTIVLAVALKIFGKALESIGKMSWEQLFKGWSTVGILVTSISAIFVALRFANTKSKGSTDALKTLTGFAIAMLGMTIALKALDGMDWKSLLASTLAMTVLIGALTASLAVLGNSKKGTAKQVGSQIKLLIGISVMAVALGASLRIIATLPWYQILASTLAMISIIGAITASLAILSKSKGLNKRKVTNLLVLLAGITVSLVAIAGSLRIIGSMPWGNILAATLAVVAVLGALVTSILLLTKLGGTDPGMAMIKVSIGIAAFSISLLSLAVGLNALGSVNMSTIFKGLISIAAAVAVLGIASAILGKVIYVILALSAALLIVAAATLVAGYGLQAIAVGLQALNQDFGPALENLGAVISATVSSILDSINNTLPQIVELIVPVISALIDSMRLLLPKVTELVAETIEQVLGLINTYGQAIIQTIVNVLTWALEAISDNIDSIANSVMNIITTLAKYLEDNTYALANILVNTIIKLLEVLTSRIGDITKSLVDFVVASIRELINNLPRLVDALNDLLIALLTKLTSSIIPIAGYVTELVLILLATVIKLTIASLGALSKLFMIFVASILLIIGETIVGLTDVMFEVFKMIVSEALRVLYKVIVWAIPNTLKIFKVLVQAVISGILKLIADMASDIPLIGEWLSDKISGVADAIDKRAEETMTGLSDGIQGVENAIRNASSNISDAVQLSSDLANEAVTDGIGQIGDTVTDAVGQIGDAFTQYGENAGENWLAGLGSSDNKEGAYDVGVDMAENAIEGTKDASETNSPSKVFARLGSYFVQGLAMGVNESNDQAVQAVGKVINDSMQLASDIIEEAEGDDYIIKVGMDITGVEGQASKLQELMSGVNNPTLTASGANALYNKKTLDRNNRKDETSTTTDNSTTVTYNNTFNIESTDPQQSADEIDKVLKQQNLKFKMAHGG